MAEQDRLHGGCENGDDLDASSDSSPPAQQVSLIDKISKWRKPGLLLLAAEPYRWSKDVATSVAFWHRLKTISLTSLSASIRLAASSISSRAVQDMPESPKDWWMQMASNGMVALNWIGILSMTLDAGHTGSVDHLRFHNGIYLQESAPHRLCLHQCAMRC